MYEWMNEWMNEWTNEWMKVHWLKCVRKSTKSRLSLTHHANISSRAEPLSRVKSVDGLRVRGISPVGKEKIYGGKDLLKNQVLSSEWNTERVKEDASGDSKDDEDNDKKMMWWCVKSKQQRKQMLTVCTWWRRYSTYQQACRIYDLSTLQDLRVRAHAPTVHLQRMQIEEQISKTHSVQFWSVLCMDWVSFRNCSWLDKNLVFLKNNFDVLSQHHHHHQQQHYYCSRQTCLCLRC